MDFVLEMQSWITQALMLYWDRVFFCRDDSILELDRRVITQRWDVLNTTKLFTLRWFIYIMWISSQWKIKIKNRLLVRERGEDHSTRPQVQRVKAPVALQKGWTYLRHGCPVGFPTHCPSPSDHLLQEVLSVVQCSFPFLSPDSLVYEYGPIYRPAYHKWDTIIKYLWN
jgi:hypothetical protein